MTARTSADHAAMWLGAAAVANLVFLLPLRELDFVAIPAAAIPALVLFGLLAMAGGWLRNKTLTLVAGSGLIATAVVQLVLHTNGAALAGGSNGSTFGLLLGLGAGLLAVALTPAS